MTPTPMRRPKKSPPSTRFTAADDHRMKELAGKMVRGRGLSPDEEAEYLHLIKKWEQDRA